eukprot:6112269-Pleurochrysis_carterae.AAC.4
MEDELAALRAAVAKEKATSRENLKKVVKLTQEKKALEAQLQEVRTQLESAGHANGAGDHCSGDG